MLIRASVAKDELLAYLIVILILFSIAGLIEVFQYLYQKYKHNNVFSDSTTTYSDTSE